MAEDAFTCRDTNLRSRFLPRSVTLRLTAGPVERPVTMFPSRFTQDVFTAIPGLDGKRALDLGTGSGALALGMLRLGARNVVATDIDEEVLAVARTNAARNGGGLAEFRLGTLFDAVRGETFDTIVCNPSAMPDCLLAADEAHLWRKGGPDGRRMLTPVARGAARHLSDGGCLVLACSSVTDAALTIAEMLCSGLDTEVVDTYRLALDGRFAPHVDLAAMFATREDFDAALPPAGPSAADGRVEVRYVLRGWRLPDPGVARARRLRADIEERFRKVLDAPTIDRLCRHLGTMQ